MNMSKLIVATVCALSVNVAMAGPESCASATMGYEQCRQKAKETIAAQCGDVTRRKASKHKCKTNIRSMCDTQKAAMQDACKDRQKN